MGARFENSIYSRVRPGDFIGRASHIQRLYELSRVSGGLVLLATPGCGLSELLRHTFDRIFFEQAGASPFYFEVRESDVTSRQAARRFLHEFLLQSVASLRNDPGIIAWSPGMAEIANLTGPGDQSWTARLIESYVTNNEPDQSFIRGCLSAPARAAAGGVKPFVIIDNAHVVADLVDGESFLADICEIFGQSSVPFVIGGYRRFLYARTPFETTSVEPYSFSDAGKFIERIAEQKGVEVNDQTRDLIAVQLGCNAAHISLLIASAAAPLRQLNSFESVEQAYTDEIFGGRIGRSFDAIFGSLRLEANLRERLLSLIGTNLEMGSLPESFWERKAEFTSENLETVLAALHRHEIVNRSGGTITIDASNFVLCDYLQGRARIEIGGEPRVIVVGEAQTANVKRAPQLMAQFYRRNSAINLRRLISTFDGRRVSEQFLNYALFKSESKGADDENILRSVIGDGDGINLPQIVYTANTSAFYPVLDEISDSERSVTGLGFAGKDDIAWLAVQIDSKLEATRDIAEFWCDRLEMAAISSGFENYKIWLIAQEGFSPDAMNTLHDRGAYGSSRKQVDLLAATLDAEILSGSQSAVDRYEIVVPMGEDSEMIAAHTVEEIAKRHNFTVRAINQIKTALVEACINATEHSLSPDRRIHQSFAVDADKLTVSVYNRGVRLADNQPEETASDSGRRGWGLKLMKGLMDDVRIEKTDDGTRITMIKYLSKAVAV